MAWAYLKHQQLKCLITFWQKIKSLGSLKQKDKRGYVLALIELPHEKL